MKDAALIRALRKKARHVELAGARADVPSPCMSVCQMNISNGLCQGCFRTLEEIAGWGTASEGTKRIIWKAIELRVSAVQD